MPGAAEHSEEITSITRTAQLGVLPNNESFAGVVTLQRNPAVTSSHTFVLVHGLGMGRDYFLSFAEALTTLGQVITIDLPGFGDAPDPSRALSVDELADAVSLALDLMRIPGQVVLIGHSMGTQVVAKVAARRHDYESVVLIAPTVDAQHRTMSAQIWRFVLDLWGESPVVLLRGGWEYMHAGIHRILSTLRSMLRDDITASVAQISAPVLVLRGEYDQVCPRDWCQQVAKTATNNTYAEIPGRGHSAMVQDGLDATEQIARWL